MLVKMQEQIIQMQLNMEKQRHIQEATRIDQIYMEKQKMKMISIIQHQQLTLILVLIL